MNIKLTLQYDGSAYHGWQIQPNAVTVQEIVCKAINSLTGEKVNITGCGRTDTGVHAISYTANFKTDSSIPPEKFAPALNTKLPRDIRCHKSEAVPDSFHAKNSAKGKTYIYRILNTKNENTFERSYSWHINQELNIGQMKKAAAAFVGEHDFIGFASSGFTVKTTVRTIYSLDISLQNGMLTISVSGNGFLYNMVRIIAGTLVFVGMGKIKAEDMEDIISSKIRERAGITAPPQGLFLKEVFY